MGLVRFVKNQFRHDRNMKRILDAHAASIARMSHELETETISRKIDLLKEKVMTSIDMGITEERYDGQEIVVSLTSFGKRIHEVYLAIESIMQGTLKPNRIILWLSEDEFKGKTLPQTLLHQQRRGLQICYCEDIKSYKKIVPTLVKYPDACIVTIDDDLVYEFDLLENLIQAHIENPEDICACRMHRITLNENNRPNSYLLWDLQIYPEPGNKSPLHFLTSGGGTLFPPHCFTKEFFNQDNFMSLCPYADDVWINAMLLLSRRKITKAYTHSTLGCDYSPIRLYQDDALSIKNTDEKECKNDLQIKSVFDHYNLYQYLSKD